MKEEEQGLNRYVVLDGTRHLPTLSVAEKKEGGAT